MRASRWLARLAFGLGIAAGLLGVALATRAVAAGAGAVDVPAPSPRALRYYRSGNIIWAVEQLLGFAIPAALLFSGFSARLRSAARRLARGRRYPTLVIYLGLLSILLFAVDLPMSYYVGYVREHAYGLSDQRLGKWVGDQLKALGVGFVVGAATLWIPYLLLARSPRRWWLWTGALSLPFFVLSLLVTPIWIAPLFNKFGPMKPENSALEKQILALAGSAGVEGARVFEVDKSADTRKVNAYVTGVGATKRIVLWDTLTERLEPRQTLFVVGHELGHYVLGHVWSSIFFSSGLVLLGLWGTHRAGRFLLGRFSQRFGFDSLADVASMPLLMLLLGAASFVLGPVELAFSRYHERQADRFGVQLTGDPHAAATALIALQESNLSIPRPGTLYKVFRASHPPIGERVDAMNDFARGQR